MTLMPARTGSSVRARRLLVAVHVLVTVSWLGGAYAILVLVTGSLVILVALVATALLGMYRPWGRRASRRSARSPSVARRAHRDDIADG
ncbi:hypothetical protein OHA25_14320 [Nonomuraea sp. NBC_00507]|uniref:hypothetical protein n=1 Tax=Nonomuraea sp. NBC_00507 TaxID=2976002 RepID=UPI002E17A63B